MGQSLPLKSVFFFQFCAITLKIIAIWHLLIIALVRNDHLLKIAHAPYIKEHWIELECERERAYLWKMTFPLLFALLGLKVFVTGVTGTAVLVIGGVFVLWMLL